MQISAPKPIAIALAIIIVAIGCAVAYRILLGTSFSYAGQLGNITLGSGDNQTTLNEFVDNSNQALSEAEASLAKLQEENEQLKAKIREYRDALAEAKKLALNEATNQGNREQITRELSGITVREPAVSVVQEQNIRKTRELISKQLQTTTAVREQIGTVN